MTLLIDSVADLSLRSSPPAVISALQAVDLSNSSDLNESDILSIVKHTRNLTSLAIENCGISDSTVLEIVRDCRMLTSIRASENALLTDDALHSIAQHCVFLTEIHVRNCTGVSVSGIFELVEKCRNLRTLVISSYGLDMNDVIEAAVRDINPEITVVFA